MPSRRAFAALLGAVLLGWSAAPATAADGWRWPVEGPVLTPFRNGSDPYAGGQHRGIDIGAPAGTAVRAATAGTVRFAGLAGASGLTVSVRTADGAFDTSYLHLGSLDVRSGAGVRAGERLGAVGTSGRRSVSQPHLHFGVRTAGSRHAYRDPLALLPPALPRSAPRGAPAPIGVPVRARPLPEPVPARRRAPARRRVRSPARRRVRVPAGRRAPLPRGVRAPLTAGGPVALPSAEPAPAAGPATSPLPGLGPAGAPAAAVGSSPAAPPAPDPAPRGTATRGEGPAGGPDLGWALACAALLLAAACIGGQDRGRPRAAGRRPGVRSLLRPLIGR
jgi:Peptidase family M23